jgi:hypothetical protein
MRGDTMSDVNAWPDAIPAAVFVTVAASAAGT